MTDNITAYFNTFNRLVTGTQVSDSAGSPVALAKGIDWAIGVTRSTHDAGNKLMFIGNGGSAGIASHLATDYSKNGDMRSLSFNDGAMLTCLGNDLGFDKVFAKQVDLHARPGDLLVAISSSGQSQNILQAVEVARDRECRIMTLSGFSPDNPLRRSGDMNFYVGSGEYGFVEVGHLALCHAILDIAMGWQADGAGAEQDRLGKAG